ncbi:hypothetical protein PGT21_015697 [Puccinia graminis f. sp. tritici]|nr:hypothetical protein PGT21_015697 [Puccinia graminis f. sp. tritici]KAA1128681.1 hypothetical protein PGTUg99_024004 [Puccinia graminis f. sp. tritici]
MRRSFYFYQPLAWWAFFLLAKLSHAPPPDAPGGQPTPEAAGGQNAKVHVVNVMVGQNGLKFAPPTVNASLHDQIVYTFFAKNHTVTETSLEEPCTPLPNVNAFHSGFVTVSMNAVEYPTQILTVNTTKPIYIACVQKMHCEMGMVAGVNLPASGPGSFDEFQKKAKSTVPKAPKKKEEKPGGAPPPGSAK